MVFATFGASYSIERQAKVYTAYTYQVRLQAMRTHVFQSGNSQAVRIPKELQFEQLDVEYEIERQGDRLVISPVGALLTDVLDLFAAFSDDFMAEGRPRPGYSGARERFEVYARYEYLHLHYEKAACCGCSAICKVPSRRSCNFGNYPSRVRVRCPL